jgi:hypothetical protein
VRAAKYTLDTPLNEAAKRKVNKYRNTYIAHHSISFLPAITSTSSRIHGEFLRLLIFLQAHRETENYFAFMDTPEQPNQTHFVFRRAAFYSSLKSKVGLIDAFQSRRSAYQYEHRQLPGRLAYCV